jgi:hypothetical protein
MIDLLCGSVEGDNSEALVVHVQNQILALLKSSALDTNNLICLWLTMTARPMRPISPL